jgi:hypothetical protein
MYRVSIALVCVITMVGIACAQTPWPLPENWKPPAQGIVPDAATAETIALAVLPHFGPNAVREIKEDAPWHAIKVGDAWQVRGTLPNNTVAGTYVVVIAQSDARIIGIFHEQ